MIREIDIGNYLVPNQRLAKAALAPLTFAVNAWVGRSRFQHQSLFVEFPLVLPIKGSAL